jgi:hypothetical protein
MTSCCKSSAHVDSSLGSFGENYCTSTVFNGDILIPEKKSIIGMALPYVDIHRDSQLSNIN